MTLFWGFHPQKRHLKELTVSTDGSVTVFTSHILHPVEVHLANSGYVIDLLTIISNVERFMLHSGKYGYILCDEMETRTALETLIVTLSTLHRPGPWTELAHLDNQSILFVEHLQQERQQQWNIVLCQDRKRLWNQQCNGPDFVTKSIHHWPMCAELRQAPSISRLPSKKKTCLMFPTKPLKNIEKRSKYWQEQRGIRKRSYPLRDYPNSKTEHSPSTTNVVSLQKYLIP